VVVLEGFLQAEGFADSRAAVGVALGGGEVAEEEVDAASWLNDAASSGLLL